MFVEKKINDDIMVDFTDEAFKVYYEYFMKEINRHRKYFGSYTECTYDKPIEKTNV